MISTAIKYIAGMAKYKETAVRWGLILVVGSAVLAYVWFDGWRTGVEHVRDGQMRAAIERLVDERDDQIRINREYVDRLRVDREELTELRRRFNDVEEMADPDSGGVGADVTSGLRELFERQP